MENKEMAYFYDNVGIELPEIPIPVGSGSKPMDDEYSVPHCLYHHPVKRNG